MSKKLVAVLAAGVLGAIAIRALLGRPPSRAEVLLKKLEELRAEIERLPIRGDSYDLSTEVTDSLREMDRLIFQLQIFCLSPDERDRLEMITDFKKEMTYWGMIAPFIPTSE